MENMKQKGYFLVKIRKTVNLYLWSEDKSFLESMAKKGMMIVPQYVKEDGKRYIDVDGQLLRIQ